MYYEQAVNSLLVISLHVVDIFVRIGSPSWLLYLISEKFVEVLMLKSASDDDQADYHTG